MHTPIQYHVGTETSGGMFSGSVGKEDAVQLLVPQAISLHYLVMEFLAFQEGLLGSSVESLYLTICLGMIGTGNVVFDICELIKLSATLKHNKSKKIQRYIKVN